MLNNLMEKFKKNEGLSIDETESLGILLKNENDTQTLSDSRFNYFNFRDLLDIYYHDLSFSSKYYKRNHNIKASPVINLEKYKKLKHQEFSPHKYNITEKRFIQTGLIVEIEEDEIKSNKESLIKTANAWAIVCINEKHIDENLKMMAKETRDTLSKRGIEQFISESSADKSLDIFIGLLKSYYVFNESLRIQENLAANQEPCNFFIDPFNFELHLLSIIHIFNRHYGHILSPSSLLKKTYHTPKLTPRDLNLLIKELSQSITESKIDYQAKLGEAILFENREEIYALFLREYKYDKSKIIVDTLFPVDEANPKAIYLSARIKSGNRIKLSEKITLIQ